MRPWRADDAATTPEDTLVTIAVLANDSDADGDALIVVSVGQAAYGTVVINPDGTVTYTPALNYSGVDSFSYAATDGLLLSAPATVTITVTAVNDAPVATDDAATTPEDTLVTIAVLANDSDADGDALIVVSVGQAVHGTVVINPDGTLTYTPALNYFGVDGFSYAATDELLLSAAARVTITVTAVNDAPVAVDDAAATDEDTPVTIPVLANDTDADGDALQVSSVSEPSHGTVAANPDGTVSYTPQVGFFGTDSFAYTVSDGNGGYDTAAVAVTVSQVGPLTATVGDFVFEDLNGDGIQDQGEPGVEGVSVQLLGVDGQVVMETTSDSSGLYLFEQVMPGDYKVRFAAPQGYRFTLQNQGSDDSRDSDADPADGTTGVLTLVRGDSNVTVDAGLARMAVGVVDIEKYVTLCEQAAPEGLSPGFWKQPQHFDAWCGFNRGDKYGEVFDVSVSCGTTLLDALSSCGGGASALMRQSTAALLNSAYPNIDYAYTQDEIVSMVQDAFSTGNCETVKNLLETENERGADLTDGDGGCGDGGPDGWGEDADEAPGLMATAGDRVVFTYVVANPGEVALGQVCVADDNETPGLYGDDFVPDPIQKGGFNIGDSDHDGLLDPGEQWLYTATKVVTEGQHVNVASVAAVPVGGGAVVTDSDGAYWLGRQEALASIGGLVWHDLHHGQCHLVDGIQDAGEPGIEGVIVNLVSDGNRVGQTTTDASGFYEFTGLAAGTYVVEIASVNFLHGGLLEGWYATLKDRGSDDSRDSDGDPNTHRSDPVALLAGEHDTGSDFGFFTTGIDLAVTGPEKVRARQAITYHFRIENRGDVVLHGGAQVYDPLINPGRDHLIWCGVLEPGQVVEFDRTYTPDSGDVGYLINTAIAIGHPVSPDGRALPEVEDESSWTIEVLRGSPHEGCDRHWRRHCHHAKPPASSATPGTSRRTGWLADRCLRRRPTRWEGRCR